MDGNFPAQNPAPDQVVKAARLKWGYWWREAVRLQIAEGGAAPIEDREQAELISQ